MMNIRKTLPFISWVLMVYTPCALFAELPFYRETDTFRIFCEAADESVADLIVQKSVIRLQELESAFRHSCRTPITFKIYPDLDTFHKETGWPDGPAWYCGRSEPSKNSDLFVSPNKPGTYHTFDSILAVVNVGLATLILSCKYGYNENDLPNEAPRWLWQGSALYKGRSTGKNESKALAQLASNPSQIPSLEQLTPWDDTAFAAANGFYCSRSLIEYIDTRWGWETVLTLLEKPAELESILGMSKEQFHASWVVFLKEKYGSSTN